LLLPSRLERIDLVFLVPVRLWRRKPANVLVEILKTVDVEIAHLTDALILNLNRLLVLVDLVQPTMKCRRADIAVTELPERNRLRFAVDRYLVLRILVDFIVGGFGVFAFRLSVGSCVSIVGGGITALLAGFGATAIG